MAARTVHFEKIGFTGLVSFLSALTKGTDENKLVKISADGTVALCADGDDINGIVRTIDSDGLAGVQLDGFVEDYPALNGNVPALGWSHVVAKTASSVQLKAATAGWKLRLVVKSDDTADVCTFQL